MTGLVSKRLYRDRAGRQESVPDWSVSEERRGECSHKMQHDRIVHHTYWSQVHMRYIHQM